MTDQPIIASHPDDPQITEAPPFALSLWDSKDEPGEVDFVVHVPAEALKDRPASPALLVGLGMLIADQQGDIDHIISRTFPDGPPSEAEAIAYADLLIKGEAA